MGFLPDAWNCRLHMCRERFPRHRLQLKPPVSDPGMHHGTCVTHVPWCMSGSLTCVGGENVPGIPSARATGNFTFLARGPWLNWLMYHHRAETPIIVGIHPCFFFTVDFNFDNWKLLMGALSKGPEYRAVSRYFSIRALVTSVSWSTVKWFYFYQFLGELLLHPNWNPYLSQCMASFGHNELTNRDAVTHISVSSWNDY